MEKDDVELIDYLREIWKRKILITMGTLVCMVAGGVVSLMSSEIYRAEALISIGRKVLTPFPSSPLNLGPLDTPKNLVKSIPAEYGLNEEEAVKDSLKVEVVKGTSLMKIIMEGPDRRRVEKLFKGVMNRLIDGHLRAAEGSIQPYRVFIGDLEAEIEVVKKGIVELDAKLKKMNTEKVDPVAVVMAQNNLWQRSDNLRNIQRNLLLYRTFVDSFKEYKTRLIGGVKKTTVKPNKKRNVLMAGVVGLAMSLFLAFFIWYLRKAREGER